MKVNEVVQTSDGSFTLASPFAGETYHSLRGAVGESLHVFIGAGFRSLLRGEMSLSSGSHPLGRLGKTPNPAGQEVRERLRILEMGFGTGLNAWLTLVEAAKEGRAVEYVAVEKFPVSAETALKLGYTHDPRFAALHSAPWSTWTEIDSGFRLLKLHGDITELVVSLPGGEGPSASAPARSVGSHDRLGKTSSTLGPSGFGLVYWDAFSPDSQPGLWTTELFARIASLMAPGGTLVTYSSKGDVRRALVSAGFSVEKLSGALGKRHMLRALITNRRQAESHRACSNGRGAKEEDEVNY